MLTFQIATPATVKLDHAKSRKEMHGEAKVLALDLSITYTTNNKFLDSFAPGWREALFCALPPGQAEQQSQEKLDLRVSDLPFLRMPNAVYPIKFDKEFSGTLRLDYGRGGDSDKVVQVCKLKSFQFTPIDGGSVEIHFAVSSAADITGELVGVFSELIQQNIVVTIVPPEEPQQVIDASKDGDAPGTEKAKAKADKKSRSATDEFVARNTGGTAAH